MTQKKICSKCKIEKPFSDFYKDKSKKHGLSGWCKQCVQVKYEDPVEREKQRISKKNWVKNNPEKVARYNEKTKEQRKKYRELNKESIKIGQQKWYEKNKERISILRKENYQLNKEEIQKNQHSYRNKPSSKKRSRNYSLMRMYGIDTNVYNQILESQNYTCAICGSNETGGRGKYFSVDHCHVTKKVRGLLCKSCNIMLGEAKDNTRILSKAIEYLGRVDNT